MARRFPAAQSPPSPCCQAAEPNSKPRVAGRGFGEGQVAAAVNQRVRADGLAGAIDSRQRQGGQGGPPHATSLVGLDVEA